MGGRKKNALLIDYCRYIHIPKKKCIALRTHLLSQAKGEKRKNKTHYIYRCIVLHSNGYLRKFHNNKTL